MYRNRLFALFAAAAVILACHGCGQIKGADLPYIASPRALVHTPASPAEGDITTSFQLIDREHEQGTVALEYSTDNGQTFSACTLVDPAEATGLSSAWYPGKTHTVQWNSVADNLALSGDATVCVKITPSDASNPSGTAGVSGAFTVNNTAFNQPPAATTATPGGVQFGNIPINYFLADVESDTCSIVVEYSPDDGANWNAATMGAAGEGLTGLSSSPGGTAHTFLWDSRADSVAPASQLDTVKVRITPTDFHAGTTGETNSFSVDNSITNDPPTVTITGGPAEGSTVSTNQVTFTWSGSDTDGSIIGYYYSFDHDPPDIWTTDTSVTSGVLSESSHTFRVVAVDDQYDISTVASRTFTVSTAGTLEITTISLPNGVEGQPYSAQLQAIGGTTPYGWSCISGSLATIGLTLNSSTGQITDTPSAGSAGVHNFTFRVDDSSGPPQSAQKNLSITIFAPGNEWTRDWNDCDFGPDDGNYKLIFEDNKIKLAPEGDEFGNTLDLTNWQKTLGDYIESGGIIISQSGNEGADFLERQVAYGDTDVAVRWSNTYPADKTYQALVGFYIGKDSDNYIGILYFARKIGVPKYNFDIGKRINGSYTLLDWTDGVGAQTELKFRIRRRQSDNFFWVYYDIGSGWVLAWSGVADHPGYMDTSHFLKPRFYANRGVNTDNWKPEADRYYQYTGDIPAQRFWPDSPECDIIDSSAGTPEYCLDAGAGNTWSLTTFAAVLSEPGTSSVKFKAGYGDTASRASATWINSGNWMTAAELNTQVAAGALDGHRYVFLKAQFNSDSTDQPTLTSVTFTGAPGSSYTASAFDTSPALDDNNQKVIIDSGSAKLAPEGDEFGDILDTAHWTKTETGVNVSEAGGIALFDKTGSDATQGTLERGFTYSSCDIAVDWSKTCPINGAGYAGRIRLLLMRDINNYVYIMYSARSTDPGWQAIDYGYRINGASTNIGYVVMGSCTTMKLRIKRDSTANTFTFYYDIGAGWVSVWSGVILDAVYFNTEHLLYPRLMATCVSTPDTTFDPEVTRYYQITDEGISAQRFWDDSPEVLVVDNAAVEWAFDAGSGYLWQVSDASCVKSEPGTSSVKFKIGGSDTGNDLDVLWLDTTWQTISEVKARAASGAYDANRYIHVKAQFASDGTDQPSLSSFSIFGAKLVP